MAVNIWCRSLQYNMGYMTFVGDGDSSAYNAVCQVNGGKGFYTVPVVKEECVNHVSKRIGKRLRKIKKKIETNNQNWKENKTEHFGRNEYANR